MSSRRTSARTPVDVRCEVVREHGFLPLGAEAVVDLSATGMRVREGEGALARVLTGEEVFFSMLLPGEGIVTGQATVARVLHGRRPIDGGSRAVGLQFEPLDPASARRLARYLAA